MPKSGASKPQDFGARVKTSPTGKLASSNRDFSACTATEDRQNKIANKLKYSLCIGILKGVGYLRELRADFIQETKKI